MFLKEITRLSENVSFDRNSLSYGQTNGLSQFCFFSADFLLFICAFWINGISVAQQHLENNQNQHNLYENDRGDCILSN